MALRPAALRRRWIALRIAAVSIDLVRNRRLG
jgi:hypothetical protein